MATSARIPTLIASVPSSRFQWLLLLRPLKAGFFSFLLLLLLLLLLPPPPAAMLSMDDADARSSETQCTIFPP
jgi:hypothetical protein